MNNKPSDNKLTQVYETTLPVLWGDMDAFGHINNVMYFRYFEQARVNWLTEELNLQESVSPEGKYGPVVMTASCEYLSPIEFPSVIKIKLLTASPGNSSFDLFYEIWDNEKPDTLYTKGHTKMVWIDRINVKSESIPDFLREKLLS